ncbi:MAG: hypothetical protein JW860_02675 [Sedimentisphaerales bacterium]|nr:hypothetical protein [Sedimentisphaerales bacterium]
MVGEYVFSEAEFNGGVFEAQVGEEVVDSDFVRFEFSFDLDVSWFADGYLGVGEEKHVESSRKIKYSVYHGRHDRGTIWNEHA